MATSFDWAKAIKEQREPLPMEPELWAAGADLDTAHFQARILQQQGYRLVRDEKDDEDMAWLIEREDSDPAAPKYWSGKDRDPTRYSAWTSNHQQAIRFSRKIDAERVVSRALKGVAVRICEHGWY